MRKIKAFFLKMITNAKEQIIYLWLKIFLIFFRLIFLSRLNYLVNRYEESVTFLGKNRINQSFNVKPEKIFPKYLDETDYNFFKSLNDDIDELEIFGYIKVRRINARTEKISLNTEKLVDIYAKLGRTKKSDIIVELKQYLKEKNAKYVSGFSELKDSDIQKVICKYLKIQLERLDLGKLPEYYDNKNDYIDLWTAIDAISTINGEVYVRDLSVRLFRDSKRLEQLKGKLESLLYKYGDFPEKDIILEDCGLIKNPSYIMVKGAISVVVSGQKLDLGKISGGIAFSSDSLRDIEYISVYGDNVITVENLTSFSHMNDIKNSGLVYLGGYHNSVKCDFLKKIYSQNKEILYYHFGDIDAGGFYIYEHLRRKTGIPFKIYNMDMNILDIYIDYTKELTSNDKNRIMKRIEAYTENHIKNDEKYGIIRTLNYMLEHGVKLEQEAIE